MIAAMVVGMWLRLQLRLQRDAPRLLLSFSSNGFLMRKRWEKRKQNHNSQSSSEFYIMYRILIYGLNHHNKYFDDIGELEAYSKELAKLKQTFQKQIWCKFHKWAPMNLENKCFYCNYNEITNLYELTV